MSTSGTAGTFTCAQLLRVQVEVDKIWADNQLKQDYESKVDVLTAIRAEQTARLQILEEPEKDRELRVYWPADCSTSLADCGDACEIGGPEPEARCETYALDICKKAGFSIKEYTFRTSELNKEQVVAKALAKRMKELDEYLAQTVVAKLNAFAGANKFLTGIGDPDSGGVTYIAPSYWTADIYGYFSQVAIMNQLNNVFMVHGGNLYQIYWQAQMNQVNANQKDGVLKLQSIRSYWDMFNIDGVNNPDRVSYMISKGAIAFASKAYYGATPTNYMDDIRYSIESKALPGVRYDVFYNNECYSGGNGDVKHNWTLYVKAGFFLNPVGCDEDVTGIIKFVCGTNAGS